MLRLPVERCSDSACQSMPMSSGRELFALIRLFLLEELLEGGLLLLLEGLEAFHLLLGGLQLLLHGNGLPTLETLVVFRAGVPVVQVHPELAELLVLHLHPGLTLGGADDPELRASRELRDLLLPRPDLGGLEAVGRALLDQGNVLPRSEERRVGK